MIENTKEGNKMKFYNTDERYGEAGPFDAENREALIAGMMPTFKVWAEEAWNKEEWDIDGEGDYDQYISEAIELMVTEFDAALEEIKE
jgi:hypothetical protein